MQILHVREHLFVKQAGRQSLNENDDIKTRPKLQSGWLLFEKHGVTLSSKLLEEDEIVVTIKNVHMYIYDN